MDRGDTWTAISDDLTRSSNRGDVPFGTLTSLSESPHRFGLIWAGTDDGQVHVTPDGGRTWNDVSGGLPADRWVSRVEASSHEEQRAYLSLNGYRDDDITAYVYVTEDLGQSWTALATGLPAEAVNVVREDPVNADVLYVGTDRGAYVSLDRGQSWQGLPNGLPNVPVHDLVVHPRERELVAGTHGRSIYILDVLPVQEMVNVRDEPVHVFPLEEVQYSRGWRGQRSPWFHRPDDDPEVKIPFWSAADGQAVLTVRDTDDRELRRLELDVTSGVNVFAWDLLLDEDKALAAEDAKNEAEASDEKDGKKAKRRNKKQKEAESMEEGTLAKTPWAEAVRLGWPLYATPATYTIRIEVGEASAETDLTMKAPRDLEPRTKAEPKIRGQQDDERTTP